MMGTACRLLEQCRLDRIICHEAWKARGSPGGSVLPVKLFSTPLDCSDQRGSRSPFHHAYLLSQTRQIRIPPQKYLASRAKNEGRVIRKKKRCAGATDVDTHSKRGTALSAREKSAGGDSGGEVDDQVGKGALSESDLDKNRKDAAIGSMKKLTRGAELKLIEEAKSGAVRDRGDIPNYTNGALKKIGIPEHYPFVIVIPISVRPLLPGVCCSLQIQDHRIMSAIMLLAKQNQPYIGAFLARDPNFRGDTIRSKKDVHEIGVFAEIRSVIDTNLGNSSVTIAVYPHRRIRIRSILSGNQFKNDKLEVPILPIDNNTSDNNVDTANINMNSAVLGLSGMDITIAHVENVPDEPFDVDDPLVKASLSEILALIRELCTINPLIKSQIISYTGTDESTQLTDASRITSIIAAISTAPQGDLQAALECSNVRERLHFGLSLLKAELENAKLHQSISKQVEKRITKRQREYFLTEQLKEIQRELGLYVEGKEKLIEGFKMKAMSLKMPPDVQNVFNEEISKLSHFEISSSEFNVARNYLDWLTCLPWGIRSEENFDVFNARLILDEDHYGLKEVKDLILEFIAIGKLKSSLEGKVVCLCGPPGVGKTSIGKSMARALNRAFFRFSVGGLSDVAEIKGHRRTYVGAMPGKPVQALKRTRAENPLIMIDEIDKIGSTGHGDPSSALLELLDPEQNSAFLDHYMDIPIDFSKVLFVCTANVHTNIPAPLLDRMELINMSGYISEEKIDIAEKYLISNLFKQCGLTPGSLKISREAIEELVRHYCRESGVRNLKKYVEKICRKVALRIATAMQYREIGCKTEPPSPQNLVGQINCPGSSVSPNRGFSGVSDAEAPVTTDYEKSVSEKDDVNGHTDHIVPDRLSNVQNNNESLHNHKTLSETGTQSSKTLNPTGNTGGHENSPADAATACSEEGTEGDKMPTSSSCTKVLHSDNAVSDYEISPVGQKTPSEANICADKMPDPSYDHGDHVTTPIETKTPSEENVASDKIPDPVVDSQPSSPQDKSDVYKLASADLDCSTLTLPVVITQENLHEYVGTRVYDADRLYEGIAPVGVTTGLAWTPMGGSILHVEAIEKPGSANSDGGPGFEYTGKLGDVMRESAEIAYSYCRKLLFEIDPGNKLLTGSKIHLHVPEGATPKDGPSAGCTMVTSILSLTLGTPISSDIAMTGEITLTGKVLKVGGIKVKVIAARRSGIKKIIMPKANVPDWKELPDYIKEGLEVNFVSEYPEVFRICFPGLDYL